MNAKSWLSWFTQNIPAVFHGCKTILKNAKCIIFKQNATRVPRTHACTHELFASTHSASSVQL